MELKDILLAISIGLLPSLIWLVFFLREDAHKEPKLMILKVFIAGALISLVAVAFQYASQNILGFLRVEKYAFVSILVLAALEEVLKFLAAYFIIVRSKFFDEPIDAMIYMIVVALGFAALENVFIALNSVFQNGWNTNDLFGTLIFRFIGATLLHALSSAIVGYYWAKKFILDNAPMITNIEKRDIAEDLIMQGIIFASLLHAIFNFLIIRFSDILVYPTIFLTIIALFVFWNFEKIKRYYRLSI